MFVICRNYEGVEDMKKYEYMVVYSVKGGIGRIQITTEKLVETYADVERFDTTIRESNRIPNAFTIDFKLLREYEE